VIEWSEYSNHAFDETYGAEDIEDERDVHIPRPYDHQDTDDKTYD